MLLLLMLNTNCVASSSVNLKRPNGGHSVRIPFDLSAVLGVEPYWPLSVKFHGRIELPYTVTDKETSTNII